MMIDCVVYEVFKDFILALTCSPLCGTYINELRGVYFHPLLKAWSLSLTFTKAAARLQDCPSERVLICLENTRPWLWGKGHLGLFVICSLILMYHIAKTGVVLCRDLGGGPCGVLAGWSDPGGS